MTDLPNSTEYLNGSKEMSATPAPAASFATTGVMNEQNEQNEEEPTLELQVENGVLLADGDIDLITAPEFRKQAERYIAETQEPYLDLEKVLFLDSAGLAVVLGLARQAKAQNKELRVRAHGNPRRVLRLTGIDQMLRMEE